MGKKALFDKKYLGRVALYIAVSAAAIGLVFYIGFRLSSEMKSGLETIFASSVSYPDTISCDAYVLRDEVTVPLGASSQIPTPVVRDGEKVRAGSVVAEAYSGTTSGSQTKILLLEEQIEFYKRCQSQHLTVGDTTAIDREISDSVIGIRRAAESGSPDRAAAYKSDMLLDIRRLGVMTGRVTDFAAEIASLESEVASLRSGLGASLGTCTAPVPGYYYSECDGYEGVLSAENAASLTYSEVKDMISRAGACDPAASQNTAGKIMKSLKWYLACPMKKEEAARLQEGAGYTVTLKNNESRHLEMKVTSVLVGGDDSVVIFECLRLPEGFDFTRLQEASVTVSEMNCFRLPVTAVRHYDGHEGVFILNRSVVTFRLIRSIREEDGYVLCEIASDAEPIPTSEITEDGEPTYYYYLAENDLVIVSGTGLAPGMVWDPGK